MRYATEWIPLLIVIKSRSQNVRHGVKNMYVQMRSNEGLASLKELSITYVIHLRLRFLYTTIFSTNRTQTV